MGVEGEVEEDLFLEVGTFLRFAPATLPTFSAAGRDRTAALPPGARAIAAGAAGFPPCTSTLPCRLRAGVACAWATPAGPTWPATRSARGEGACATSTVTGDGMGSSMAARDGRRAAAGACRGGAMVAEGAGSGKGRAEMFLPPNLAPDRGRARVSLPAHENRGWREDLLRPVKCAPQKNLRAGVGCGVWSYRFFDANPQFDGYFTGRGVLQGLLELL